MFQQNAVTFFNIRTNLEPEVTEYIGAFPEDDPPVVWIYRLESGDTEKYVVVQRGDNSLLVRFATEEEVEDLQSNPPSEPEEVRDDETPTGSHTV